MMWECKLGARKPCLRAALSRSTGRAHWEYVHSILYGLWSSWLLLLGTSGVTVQRNNASPKSVQEEHKDKVNFLPDVPSEPTCPLPNCDLCSSWGDPSPRGLGLGSQKSKRSPSWSGSSASTLPGTTVSVVLEILIVPWTCHTFSGLHIFPLHMVFSWLECPFLPAS